MITLLLLLAQPPGQVQVNAPYVTTPDHIVSAMLKLAGVKKTDTLYDLGCGDGRIVISAARQYGAHGVGIDINPQRVQEARANARKAGVEALVKFEANDIFEADIHAATVVTLYLLPDVNLRLRPKLLRDLKPGTRVVSHDFAMGDWKPDKQQAVDGGKIYLWTIPPKNSWYIQKMFRRVIWIVLDSVGIGEMPDAAAYGDAGSDTLGNLARLRPLSLPNLCRLGLGNIKPLAGLPPATAPQAAFGRATLASPGKDTTTGHWEMCGIHLDQPLPLFPNGFPPEIMREFEAKIGRGSLGNRAASGTEIIKELGAEHMRTGSPIVYTSADSVFQIAAHEQVIPLPELYRICDIAREILRGPFEVGRVIARPFTGSPGAFERTPNRKDYAIPPPPHMLLDQLSESGRPAYSVGKIFDVFLGRGIDGHVKTKNNADGMARTIEAMSTVPGGLIYVNLVDFDQLYGHRNDVEGYARALEQFDAWLPGFEQRLDPADLVILTADHGCDPTTPSTDHSREYVPVLVFGPRAKPGVELGLRSTLSDLGQTVAENFGCHLEKGTSFLPAIV